MSSRAAREAMNDLLARRIANQRLGGTLHASPADVVSSLGAVQSQDFPGAKWAVGQRVKNGTDAAVEAAFNRGEILRLHILRPTWHFVAPADIRWMVALSGPRVRRILASYDRQLGLDDKVLARALRVVERALRDRAYKTRDELAVELKRAGIEARGQMLARIAGHAELIGLVCSGPQRGRLSTYALVDERVAPAAPLTRDEAVAELTRRYFTSHGPATIRDFVWWSGLTVADARLGLDITGATAIESDSLRYFLLPSRRKPVDPAGTVHLLPNYDEYVVAYKDRASIGAAGFATLVAEQRVDVFGYYVVIDGKLNGSWRRVVDSGKATVTVDLHSRQPRAARDRIAAEVARFGAFYGVPATIRFARHAFKSL